MALKVSKRAAELLVWLVNPEVEQSVLFGEAERVHVSREALEAAAKPLHIVTVARDNLTYWGYEDFYK